MPEFGVGGDPPRTEPPTYRKDLTLLDALFGTPDKEHGFLPSSAAYLIEQVEDLAAGRADLNFAEKKGIEKGIAKAIRSGPITDILDKLLFGDKTAGAPDPEPGTMGSFRDENGNTYTVNAKGERVYFKMLPMWTADP